MESSSCLGLPSAGITATYHQFYNNVRDPKLSDWFRILNQNTTEIYKGEGEIAAQLTCRGFTITVNCEALDFASLLDDLGQVTAPVCSNTGLPL